MAVEISKEKAGKLRKEVQQSTAKGNEYADQLLDQFDELHSEDRWYNDREIETLLLEQKQRELDPNIRPESYPKDIPKFNPSGASKTPMDLYLKGKGFKEEQERYPYHRRWTRNSTAIHEVVQRDLLYAEKHVKDPAFRVARTKEGYPAWEENILTWRVLEHKGEEFVVSGMMDGILIHNETEDKVGFELKTKSNTVGQVGYYLMRNPADYHVEQVTAYYLLTGLRDYIITYEGLAKPKWNSMDEARPDLRTFHVHISDEMAEDLLDKWANVSKLIRTSTPPEDKELGFFSGYGYLFDENGEMLDKYKDDSPSAGTR